MTEEAMRGLNLTTERQRQRVQKEFKKKMFVAESYETGKLAETVRLGGESIAVHDSRVFFHGPEAIFAPERFDWKTSGLAQRISQVCDNFSSFPGLKEEFRKIIVLVGGNAMLAGFPERLRQELGDDFTVLTVDQYAGKIDPSHLVFVGSKTLAKQPDLRWINRSQYEEKTMTVVNDHCF